MELDFVKLKEIKPALSAYIRETQALLKLAPVPDEKSVHDIRVLMKKSRAVMKLIASQMDEESFNREYLAFREIGRITRSWRDTSVHRKTLKDLKKDYPEIFTLLGANSKLELLMKKSEIPEEPLPDMKEDIWNIDELLNKAGFRVRFRNMNDFDPKTLLNELDKTYNEVVDKYLVCRNNPKPVNIHRFRKRSKDFLYQLYFFRPLNPAVVKGLEKKLDGMTQNLGKFNDLAQIIVTLEYKYSGLPGQPALDELILLIRDEQDRYLSKVWPAAYKVFCPGQKLVNLLGFRILMI